MLVLEVAFPVPAWFLGTDDLSLYPFKSSFSLVCSSCSKAEVSYYPRVVMSLLCHIQASNLLRVFMRKVSSVQRCSSVMSFSFSVIMELGGTEELTEAFDTQTILVSESIVANKIRKM